MKKIKSLAVAALLALSANVSAGETVTRQEYIPKCEARGMEAGNVRVMSQAVCNCSAQMISYVLTEELNRYEQWALDSDHPLIQISIDSCVQISNDQPYNFLLHFGSERASIR